MVNWKSELTLWLPTVRCVYYHGHKVRPGGASPSLFCACCSFQGAKPAAQPDMTCCAAQGGPPAHPRHTHPHRRSPCKLPPEHRVHPPLVLPAALGTQRSQPPPLPCLPACLPTGRARAHFRGAGAAAAVQHPGHHLRVHHARPQPPVQGAHFDWHMFCFAWRLGATLLPLTFPPTNVRCARF